MTLLANRPVRLTKHWAILVALFALANFLEVGVMAHFVLFTPAFLSTIGFGTEEINAWTGPTASVAFLLGIWFVPFWGVLADRYGRKPLILRSYYVEIVAMVIAALSWNIWLYLFARSLTGLALGNTGLMYASLTETAPRNRVALSLSLVNSSAPLGGLVGALAGGWIVTQFGVHALFWMDAGVALVIALLLTLFYHETFVPRETPPLGVMLGDALQAVVRSPVATTIFLVSFVYNAAFFFSYTYLPVRIGELVGARNAPAVIGLTQGVAGLATLTGSAVWGGLADRIGHRRLLIGLMAAAMVLWLPIYAVQDITGLAAAWALFSAISPSVTSLMITIISLNIETEKRGAVLSMIYLPLNVAFVIAPFSASFVARNLEVRDVFLVSSVLAFLALLIFTLNLGRTRGEQNVAAGK
jgi:DHA1 family multidrug resistance protein-like MFS transporter